MKKMMMFVVVVLAVQASFAAGKVAVDKVSLENARTEMGIDKSLSGRGIKPGDKEFIAKVTKAAPKLAEKTGLTATAIVSLLAHYPEALDALVTAKIYSASTDTKQLQVKTSIEGLIEGLAQKRDMDDASLNNKVVAKTLELLSNADKYPESMVSFAKEVAKGLETSSIKDAIEVAVKKYAAAKGMTIAEWLEALINCTKNA